MLYIPSGQHGPSWRSLVSSQLHSLKDQTLKIFEAHRREFLADDDLQKIAEKLGKNSGEVTCLSTTPRMRI